MANREYQAEPVDDARLLAELAQPVATSWRGLILSWIAALLFLSLLILVIGHFAELSNIIQLLVRSRFSWVAVAILAQAATYLCAAAVWWRALFRLGYRIAFWSLAPLGLAKLFVDQALPTGGVSGALFVVAGLIRRSVPLQITLPALLSGMLAYYGSFVIATLASVIILARDHKADSGILLFLVSFLCVAIAIPAFVMFMTAYGIKMIPDWARRTKKLRLLLDVISNIQPMQLANPWLLIEVGFIQLCIFLLDSYTLWAAFRAIQMDISYPMAFTGWVMGSVSATIGPAPLGLGTFEGGAILALRLVGVPLESSVAAILLTRALTFWLPMLPGLILARVELHGVFNDNKQIGC